MKHLIIIFVLCPIISFSQAKKETVYIMFDKNTNETCKIEDGSGELLTIKKYRKDEKGEKINFRICNETFIYTQNIEKKDTCNIKVLEKIKFKGTDYLIQKYEAGNDFKHHVFEKIYIVENISESKIIKYEVYWSGEWTIE